MSYNIIPTPRFKREAKALLKRHKSLKEDLIGLEKLLQKNPDSGTPLGNNTFKVRLSIKSKGKGKSGGARVITYVLVSDNEIYLLTIYDKSDFATVDDKTLKALIKEINTNRQ